MYTCVCSFVCLFVCLFVCFFVCSFVRLFVCLFLLSPTPVSCSNKQNIHKVHDVLSYHDIVRAVGEFSPDDERWGNVDKYHYRQVQPVFKVGCRGVITWSTPWKSKSTFDTVNLGCRYHALHPKIGNKVPIQRVQVGCFFASRVYLLSIILVLIYLQLINTIF